MRNLLLQADYNTSSVTYPDPVPLQTSSRSHTFYENQRPNKKSKKSSYFWFIVVIVVVISVTFFSFKKSDAPPPSPSVATAQAEKKPEIQEPLAVQEINKPLAFTYKGQTGKAVSKFEYLIQSVELRNQVIIKNQTATAVPGRMFLIINLKITNNADKPIALNTRDYLRVIVNGSSEKFAPDIHNDPIEIQAISTKYTRVGLALNENDKDLTLQVGEITGKKQLIKLNLK